MISSASYLGTSPSNFSQLYLVEGPGGFAPQFAPAFRPAFPRSSPRSSPRNSPRNSPRSSPTISPRSPRNSPRTPRPFSHGNRYDDERAGQVVEAKDGPELGTGGGRHTARTGSIILLWTERRTTSARASSGGRDLSSRNRVLERTWKRTTARAGVWYYNTERRTGCWSGRGHAGAARAGSMVYYGAGR